MSRRTLPLPRPAATRRVITHAHLVTPTTEIPDGALVVDDGRIVALGPAGSLDPTLLEGAAVVDVDGAYVLPGLVDLHTDTLEKEITPRPAADFPVEIAVQELDRKMVACGITTVYHSVHIGYADKERLDRSRYSRRDVVDGVRRMAAAHTLARTRIHLRYEVVGHGVEVLGTVEALLDDGHVDLLSFMDHTPGQGQYSRGRFLARREAEGVSPDEVERELVALQARPRVELATLGRVAARALARGVPVASHDDDTEEKVHQMRDLGVTISEFPVTMTAARAAKAADLVVLGGASNVLRGGSLTGNLDVTAGVVARMVDGLCSDYYPPAMLHAAFKLARAGVVTLPQAVQLVSTVPAHAAGDTTTGALAPGRDADLIVVQMHDGRPVVHQTFVRGERVHMAGREVFERRAG